MKTVFLAVVSAVVLAGCMTPSVPSKGEQFTPPDRLLALQAQPAGEYGTLVVTRDVGTIIGAGCYYGFSVNGVLAARMDTGDVASFRVSPGELLMRVGRDPQGNGLCGTSQEHWTQRETILRAGETKRFRLSVDSTGKKDIQRAD